MISNHYMIRIVLGFGTVYKHRTHQKHNSLTMYQLLQEMKLEENHLNSLKTEYTPQRISIIIIMM